MGGPAVLGSGLLWMTLYTGLLLTLWAGAADWLVGAGWWIGAGCWIGAGWSAGAGLLCTEVGSSVGSKSMSSQSGRQYADGGPAGWAVAAF